MPQLRVHITITLIMALDWKSGVDEECWYQWYQTKEHLVMCSKGTLHAGHVCTIRTKSMHCLLILGEVKPSIIYINRSSLKKWIAGRKHPSGAFYLKQCALCQICASKSFNIKSLASNQLYVERDNYTLSWHVICYCEIWLKASYYIKCPDSHLALRLNKVNAHIQLTVSQKPCLDLHDSYL